MKNHPVPLLGMAIGDALGMPFETMKPDNPALTDWYSSFQPSAHHKLTAGQYTDDTQMALALTDAIIGGRGHYTRDNAAAHYLRWYLGTPRGIGNQVRRAMERLKLGVTARSSGACDPDAPWLGNGASMRVAPLGVLYPHPEQRDVLRRAVYDDAAITHDHPDAQRAAFAVAAGVAHACHTRTRGVLTAALDATPRLPGGDPLTARLRRLRDSLNEDVTPSGLAAEGAADDATGISAMALFLVDVTDSYAEAINLAVRLGGDTDTRAAIVGAMAGAIYGFQGIPELWVRGVEDGPALLFTDGRLHALSLSPAGFAR